MKTLVLVVLFLTSAPYSCSGVTSLRLHVNSSEMTDCPRGDVGLTDTSIQVQFRFSQGATVSEWRTLTEIDPKIGVNRTFELPPLEDFYSEGVQLRLLQLEHGGWTCNCWKVEEAVVMSGSARTDILDMGNFCSMNLANGPTFCHGLATEIRGFISRAGRTVRRNIEECPGNSDTLITSLRSPLTERNCSTATDLPKLEVAYGLVVNSGNCAGPTTFAEAIEFAMRTNKAGVYGPWIPLRLTQNGGSHTTLLNWWCHISARGDFGDLTNSKSMFHVQPMDSRIQSVEAEHMLNLDDNDDKERRTCGCGENEDFIQTIHESKHHTLARRQAAEERRYIEWAMLNDAAQFSFNGRNLQRTVQRSLAIANGVNALYSPFNITVALTTVITFTGQDRFPTPLNSTELLLNFTLYAIVVLQNSIAYDGIMLLTGMNLDGTIVGTAFIGTMCNRTLATALVQDGGTAFFIEVVTTAAHELGHNLNMQHDDDRGCVCGDVTGSCVMAASLNFPPPTRFSSCSVSELNDFFTSGQDFCLFNAPTETVGDPQCGNGIVEENEECDCGSPLECAAVDVCCTSQCTLATYGTVCRPSTGECDIAEYCLGNSPSCPQDVGVANGVSCASNFGFCLNGKCPTHDSQCRAAFNSDAAACYFLNQRGDFRGFCQQTLTSFIPCEQSNILCGKLQCGPGNYTGIFGAAFIASVPLTNGITCMSARTDPSAVSPSQLNLANVADGTRCGGNTVCQSRTCVPRASIVACPNGLNNSECSGPSRGVCNNRGACSCNVGFTGATCQTTRPISVNECQTNNGGCAQVCIDTANSFRCFCNPGFVLASDNRNCQDVNECLTSNGGCPQVCTNTVGSFRCSCNPGFTLASDNINCINTDVNECLTSNGGCDQICTNTPGSFQCSCNTGFVLANNDLNCNNVNECQTGNGGCAQICSDTPGSFQCSCNPGFTLATDSLNCINVNECLTNNGGCAQICSDTPGSFQCSCSPGFILDDNNLDCTDINECLTSNEGCAQICINTPGSFRCSCNPGFGLAADNVNCIDANECQTNNGGCSQICTNTPGSFTCSCNLGFTLADNNLNCTNINECQTSNGRCSQICTDTPGSFQCSCNPGFTLAEDSVNCINVNECLTNNGGCSQICIDTSGSFTCSCNPGFFLDDDNLDCTNINECETNNGGCSQICSDTPGSFQCSCNPGFTLTSNELSCTDINECDTNNGGCSQVCENAAGSFKCDCNAGFVLGSDGFTCSQDDVNECLDNNGGCAQICTNTVGSFQCSCGSGYTLASDNLNCNDVNECSFENGGCDQICRNTNGSFECSCGTSYTLSSDNFNCSDIDECSTENGGCNQTCTNTDGSFECWCDTGYTLASDNRNCEDIDECLTDNGNCSQICNNSAGSFQCSCNPGFQLATDGFTCNSAQGPCATAGLDPGCCVSGCNTGQCWCDTICHSFNDCCSDVPPLSELTCT